MTASGERIVEQLKKLPQNELREVWQTVSKLLAEPPPAPISKQSGGTDDSQTDGITPKDEATFFEALEEARQLWGRSERELPQLD